MSQKLAGGLMELNGALLAQDIRHEVGGLQTIVGIFPSRLKVRNFPLSMNMVHFRMDHTTFAALNAQCALLVVSPSEKELMKMEFELAAKEQSHSIMTLGWGPFSFEEAGKYRFLLKIGNAKPDEIFSFELIQEPPQEKSASAKPKR